MSATIVSDTIITMVEQMVMLALADGEAGMLTQEEGEALETCLTAISKVWPEYLDYFFPDPDDGDDCFADRYGWSPEQD